MTSETETFTPLCGVVFSECSVLTFDDMGRGSMRATVAWSIAAFLCGVGPARTDHAILIYGGREHRTFLGCLNCSETDPNSVLNQVGQYGSEVSSDSIFDKAGEFGSPVSDTSPCNPVASDPPVLVDQNGGFHGYLTLNRSHADVNPNGRLAAWLAAICH